MGVYFILFSPTAFAHTHTNPMGATIRSAKWLPLCHIKTFCFLSRQMLCSAKRGQVQLCLIAHTLRTHTCAHTHTYTHIHTHTHTQGRSGPRWLIRHRPSQIQLFFFCSQITPSPPTLFSKFKNNINETQNSESKINAKQAVSSNSFCKKGCFLFVYEVNNSGFVKSPWLLTKISNESSDLIWSIIGDVIPLEPLVSLWPVWPPACR